MNINNHGLMFLVRRTLTVSSNCRFYSSSPTSSHTSNKLFVAGLSWSVNEKSLKDAFSSFGNVTEVRILYDKETGRSRGFGFVYFIKEFEAESAKQAMDGKAMMGRPLRICFALDKVRGGHVVVPRLSNPEGLLMCSFSEALSWDSLLNFFAFKPQQLFHLFLSLC